jgi:biotin carboxyl carrier protein
MLKKILAIICSLSMALAVASCGSTSTSGTSVPVKDVQTDEAEIVATPAPVKVERPVEEPKYPVETAKSSSGWAAVTPLPGTIVDVLVSKGDLVKKGQTLVILEAMKMENHIESEVDGVVAEVSVSKGDTVLEGEKIVVLD